MAIANLNIAIVEESLGYTSDNEFLEFLRAAQNGNIAGLESFLGNRPEDINRCDDLYDAAATHFAARHSQVDALRFLIDRGAVLGNPTNAGYNELHFGFGSLEVSSLIIEKRPDLIDSTTESFSALILAIYCKNFDVASFLISQNADVNFANRNGNTALHYIADSNSDNAEIAFSLIQKGADINAINHNGNSVLATTIGSGNLEISKLLLQQQEIIIDANARENLNLQLRESEGFEEIEALLNQRSIPNSIFSSRAIVTRLSDEIIDATRSASDSDTEQQTKRKRLSPGIDAVR